MHCEGHCRSHGSLESSSGGNRSNVLHKVCVSMWETSECNKKILQHDILRRPYPNGATTRIICASDNDKDSCQVQNAGFPLSIREIFSCAGRLRRSAHDRSRQLPTLRVGDNCKWRRMRDSRIPWLLHPDSRLLGLDRGYRLER
ncbi:unnamed protein product [Darwinula stevensoni]|uniref:Uncharacterized protein n=1 Tax=Darwinula stevensoni TaxID=69355 RepID=A0A7R9A1L6_9CRUS|nr:unnamed protein product [Darwinula stevensoni]CAG0887970.1 unnamed protein product [Darwinula stevensoni]